MAYFTAHRFAQRYGGYDAVRKFIEACNNTKYSLSDIAHLFNMSPSQACRYRDKLFQVQFVPTRGLLDFLGEMKERDEMRVEDKDKFITKITNNVVYADFGAPQKKPDRA